MLGLSKVCFRVLPIAFTLAALVLAGGITNLQANPVCNSTIDLGPTGTGAVLDSQLTAGVCVLSQDKLFGDFSLTNLPNGGIVIFGLVTSPTVDRHTIAFNNAFLPNTTYNPDFEVEAIDGAVINMMTGSFNQGNGGPTMLVQTVNPAASSGAINVTGIGNQNSGPNTVFFAPSITDLTVNTTFTTGPGSDAQNVTDAIFEPIPEPVSLELLGLALTGFGVFVLRRKS